MKLTMLGRSWSWLKRLFTRRPAQCLSCTKWSMDLSFKAIPEDLYSFGTRPGLEKVCIHGVPGFPNLRNCKQYREV